MSSGDLYYLSPSLSPPEQEEPFYWEAAILGCAFVALLLGSLGVLIIICHAYHRSRHFKEESRKRRAVQLYDSIVVKSDKSQLSPGFEAESSIVNMPGESAGTMSKAMSYDVNPVYETSN